MTRLTIREYEEDPSSFSPGETMTTQEKQSHSLPFLLSEVNVEVSEDPKTTTTTTTTTTTLVERTTILPQQGLVSATSTLFRSPRKVLQQLFLPIGYPHSVDETYLPYQLYDGLQGLCSYWRGVVSAQAVFEASGVGDANRTALSAALTWALRDGTGMLGGLLYSYCTSHYFDAYVKEFRLLLADVINDVALTLDLVAPLFGPTYSVYILTLSTMGKTICGITAGATKGRITHHFARRNGNMADLTAKESTQETLVSLVGMLGGVWVARWLNDAPPYMTWFMFGVLTILHVWANYKGVALLKLATLNPERTRVLFRDVLKVMADGDAKTDHVNSSADIQCAVQSLPSPERTDESMMSSVGNLLVPTICVARPFQATRFLDVNGGWCSLFDLNKDVVENLPYVVGCDRVDLVQSRKARVTLFVWLKVGASMQDELQAYLHSLLLHQMLKKQESVESGQKNLNRLFQATLVQIKTLFDDSNGLMQKLEKLGWDLETRFYLGFSSHRLQVTIKDD